jgi:hypothetical protein
MKYRNPSWPILFQPFLLSFYISFILMGVVYLSYSSIAAWVLCVSLGFYSVYVRSVNFDLLCRYQKHSMHSIASIFRVANDDR